MTVETSLISASKEEIVMIYLGLGFLFLRGLACTEGSRWGKALSLVLNPFFPREGCILGDKKMTVESSVNKDLQNMVREMSKVKHPDQSAPASTSLCMLPLVHRFPVCEQGPRSLFTDRNSVDRLHSSRGWGWLIISLLQFAHLPLHVLQFHVHWRKLYGQEEACINLSDLLIGYDLYVIQHSFCI